MDANMIIKAKIDELETVKFDYFGVRFDARTLAVGDELGNSKSNFDRDDSREFPVFGTEEYEAMEDLDGTCSYDADKWGNYIDLDDCDDHVYLIAGNDYYEGEDMDEMIIEDAVVVAILK